MNAPDLYTQLKPGLIVSIPIDLDNPDEDDAARVASSFSEQFGVDARPMATYRPNPTASLCVSVMVRELYRPRRVACRSTGVSVMVRTHPSDAALRLPFGAHADTSVALWARNLAGRARLVGLGEWRATSSGFASTPAAAEVVAQLSIRPAFARSVVVPPADP